MAYDLVAQADRDVLSDTSNSLAGSPLQVNTFRPISMDFENLEGKLTAETNHTKENGNARLDSIMRSTASTGTSYDMLEDDDYEDIQETPVKKPVDHSFILPQPHSSAAPAPGRIRTASIGASLPLRHPTPDLQSMQGAYIKKVERLEESAERLSVTSILQEGLQKMKFDQRPEQRQSSAPIGNTPAVYDTSRQVSSPELTNSISGYDSSAKLGSPYCSRRVNSPKPSLLSRPLSHAPNPEFSAFDSSPFAKSPVAQSVGQNHLQNARQNMSFDLRAPEPPPHTYQPGKHVRRASGEQSPRQDVGDAADDVRPSTSASNDTYRQATTLFVDFDGVHCTSHSHPSPGRQMSVNRQVAINQPPLAADATAFSEPHPGKGMVYYPAPVPMMLNLPQKLSKQPSPAERDRRRQQALGAMPNEMRKSAAWLSDKEKTTSAEGAQTSQALSSLPPQLLASAFFDHPGLGQDIDIKCASAVDTLDSILDASAYAPVSAFTDHPFAGHLGGEVYGAQSGQRKSVNLERKKKRRSSISNLLRTSTGLTVDAKSLRSPSSAGPSVISQGRLIDRRSTVGMNESEAALADGEDQPLRMSGDFENTLGEMAKSVAGDPGEEKGEEGLDKDDDDQGEESDVVEYNGPPTTLLAELQMRKAQQKLRNRTAANAFPNGMHSTLLELDAVAHLQQKSRKKKHITLAWEDREIGDRTDFDDEDIPLGLLAGGQKAQQNFNRPMGLMEKREMEDNEPLSRRRARLRGDDLIRPPGDAFDRQRASTMYTLELPSLIDDILDEQDDETLAQRIQRIKTEKESRTGVGDDLIKDVSGQLESKTENVAPEATIPEAEETLGQRRKRLREEALKTHRQSSGGSAQNVLGVKARSSMADILSLHPAAGARQPSGESRTSARQSFLPQIGGQSDSYPNQLLTFQQQMMNSYLMPGTMSYPSFDASIPYMNGVPGFHYNNPMMYSPGLAMQMGGYGQNGYLHDPIMMGPPLDPKQRDMIDRWRQGVAP